MIGSFPTANCRTVEELDAWLADIKAATAGAAPFCPNLIVHRSNPRVQADLAAVLRAKAEIVITSVGSPEPVMKPLKDAGCLVLADVASVRHAQKAVAAGVDGLVLLTAGAGGQTGWVNPFAFVRAVRQFWDGIVVMAGGMSDGHAIAAAETLGCDLAYMGTKFIATRESLAKDDVQADAGEEPARRRAADARLHRPRDQHAAPVDRRRRPRSRQSAAARRDRHRQGHQRRRAREKAEEPNAKRWKDIWSAGHSVSACRHPVGRRARRADGGRIRGG